MRGHNETGLTSLVDFAAEKGLLLRFIELMPVSTTRGFERREIFPCGGSEADDRSDSLAG